MVFKQVKLYWKPTTYRCQQIFDSAWLACYSQPKQIESNNRGKFKAEFKEFYTNMGLEEKEKTSLP